MLKVLRDQRKTIMLAGGRWPSRPSGSPGSSASGALAGCIAGGIGLGLVNHLATEYWLLQDHHLG